MATCHYAKIMTSFLDERKVDYVKKSENAPNLPQARPIERFWAFVKRKYSKVKKTPKNLKAFKRIITRLIKEVAAESGKTLMRRVRQKIRAIGRQGVLGPLKG